MTTTKKPYQRPAMTVVEIATEQVICTSPSMTQQYSRNDANEWTDEFE